MKVKLLVIQLCLTLCNPINCNLPGYFVRGIVQARILEWAAIPFSKSDPGIKFVSLALQADSLLSEPPGKPKYIHTYIQLYMFS